MGYPKYQPRRNDNRRPVERKPAERLAEEKFDVDEKRFFLDLLENDRGRVLKIKETHSSYPTTAAIMVPVDGLADLIECLQRIHDYADSTGLLGSSNS